MDKLKDKIDKIISDGLYETTMLVFKTIEEESYIIVDEEEYNLKIQLANEYLGRIARGEIDPKL
jgi:hypothetical protein